MKEIEERLAREKEEGMSRRDDRPPADRDNWRRGGDRRDEDWGRGGGRDRDDGRSDEK